MLEKMQQSFLKQPLKTLKSKSRLVFYSCDCRKMGQTLSGDTLSSNLPRWTRQSHRDWMEVYGAVSAFIYL